MLITDKRHIINYEKICLFNYTCFYNVNLSRSKISTVEFFPTVWEIHNIGPWSRRILKNPKIIEWPER